MLKSVRLNVFETNSSSTHSLTLVSKEDYEAWKNGEYLIDEGDDLVTKEQAIKELKEDYPDKDFDNEDVVNELLEDYCFKTYKEYFNDEYLETFTTRYTSKSGDEVVAFGKYGYEG